MVAFFIRNTRFYLLSVSITALFYQSDGFTTASYALEPDSTEQIDGLNEGQTTYGPNGYWKPYVEADGFIWDKAASNGNLRLWSPLIQNPDWILHTTIGGGFFETDGAQGSAGIGFRHVIGDAILGVYGFADVTFTEFGNTFWRLSPGVELLGLNYEARVNAYFPIGEDQYLTGNTVAVGGGGAMSGLLEYETNFMGVDGEAGFRLPVEIGEENLHDFWLYGGANYYDHENAEELYGADARFEWRINKLTEEYPGSRLSFIANASWNNVDDFDYGGGIRARIPLGKRARCFNRYPDDRTIDCPTRNGRMDAAVIRRTRGDQIVQQDELLIDSETDVLMRTVVTVNDPTNTLVVSTIPSGSGTLLPIEGVPDNYTDLTTATTGPTNTDEVLVVVNGGPVGGTPITYSGQFEVDSNTTVLGTGTTIELVGQTTQTSYSYSVAGERPQFDFNGNGSVLDLDGTGIHIAGLGVSGEAGLGNAGNHGIFIQPGGSNVAIEQNIITDLSGNGIHSDGPTTDVRIFDNNNGGGPGFGNIDGDAIHFAFDNDDTEISGNWFENIIGTGILFGDDNDNAIVRENTLLNLGADGISFGNQNDIVRVVSNRIDGTGSDGIHFDSLNTDLRIEGNDIRNSLADGIQLSNNNVTVDVINNDIIGVAEGGIEFEDNNSDVRVSMNDVFSTGEEGIRFDGSNSDITVFDNDTIGTGRSGISFSDRNFNIFVDMNRVNGANAAGIRFGNDGGENINITNNSISNVSNFGIIVGGTNPLFPFASVESFITGNTVTNSQGFLFGGQTYGTGYSVGISLASNNDFWVISQNSIFGANSSGASAGISLANLNTRITISNNTIDGLDYASGTGALPSTMEKGIEFSGTQNDNIIIGGSVTADGNTISNVLEYGIHFNGGSGNFDNTNVMIQHNDISSAGSAGIRLRHATDRFDVFDNIISASRAGIEVGGTSVANNMNISIQRNNIAQSIVNGIIINRGNSNIDIIGNTIVDVPGNAGTNGDGINIVTNNTFGEISGNRISGTLGDAVFQIGANNTFLNPSQNTMNNASLVIGTTNNCRAPSGAVGNVTLVPIGGGATITCP